MRRGCMRIALDFDGVVTRDRYVWCQVVELLLRYGHEVVLVTNRGPGLADPDRFPEKDVREVAEAWGIPLVLCGPRPKASVPDVDVWIDDHPEWVHGGPWLQPRFDDGLGPAIVPGSVPGEDF